MLKTKIPYKNSDKKIEKKKGKQLTILLQTYMYTTKTTEGLLHSDDQVKEKDLNLGDWVVVVFDQTRYPGPGGFLHPLYI